MKNRLCSPIASKKLYDDPNYQEDRMSRLALISNSVSRYLNNGPMHFFSKNDIHDFIKILFVTYFFVVKPPPQGGSGRKNELLYSTLPEY
jgi:hypothetical protein